MAPCHVPSLQSVILGCADTKALVVDASHGNPSFFAPVGRAFLGSGDGDGGRS